MYSTDENSSASQSVETQQYKKWKNAFRPLSPDRSKLNNEKSQSVETQNWENPNRSKLQIGLSEVHLWTFFID